VGAHLFLSPHLDDAVLSAGGVIDALARAGERVVVATFCTADPPPDALGALARDLHARWGNPREPYAARRREDLEACTLLGAEARHLGLLDAIYRGTYSSFADLFGPLPDADLPFRALVATALARVLGEVAPHCVYAPLAVGRNVDHQHVHEAARTIAGPELFFYEDQPYSTGTYGSADSVAEALARSGVRVEPDARAIDFGRKKEAIRRYASQLEELFGADLAGLDALPTGVERLWRATMVDDRCGTD
jgi:LmbE family N-acetylglucosaminyl deacetylase